MRTRNRCLLLTTAVVLASCAIQRLSKAPERPRTTFERVLPLAAAGDPEFQNLLGFMHFYGEGTERDLAAAHRWFHLAATSGHALGQRNDTYIHHRMDLHRRPESGREQVLQIEDVLHDGLLPDPALQRREWEAGRLRDRMIRGEQTYAMFCAGCHGLNGIAALVQSPSFALSERLEKTDEQLLRSITHGIGVMPGWGGKVSEEVLKDVVAFIRTLRPSYELGVSQSLRDSPPMYFLFGPMTDNHAAHRGR